MIPLAFCNGRARIVNIYGGRGLIRKLYSLGLLPGEIVRVVNNMGGPILVEVRGSRVAIGRGMAMKIYVEPV